MPLNCYKYKLWFVAHCCQTEGDNLERLQLYAARKWNAIKMSIKKGNYAPHILWGVANFQIFRFFGGFLITENGLPLVAVVKLVLRSDSYLLSHFNLIYYENHLKSSTFHFCCFQFSLMQWFSPLVGRRSVEKQTTVHSVFDTVVFILHLQ